MRIDALKYGNSKCLFSTPLEQTSNMYPPCEDNHKVIYGQNELQSVGHL